MPVEEELDGWEVKVEFNKNFSKLNFFNGLSEVRFCTINKLVSTLNFEIEIIPI